MNIEKISEVEVPTTNFSKLFFSIIKEETTNLRKIREGFSPKKYVLAVKKAWQKNEKNYFITHFNQLIFSTIIYWFLPGWAIFALLKIFFSKQLWVVTFTKIQIKLSNHRSLIRFTLISQPLNLTTIISLLPFFVGFYDFLNQNQHLKKTLFQNNIPGLVPPTEILDWNTFRYFSETKKEFLTKIEKVEWAQNSIILTKTLDTEFFDQESFIGSVNKNNLYKTIDVTRITSPKQVDFSLENQTGLKNLSFYPSTFQSFGSNRIYIKSFNKKLDLNLKSSRNISQFLQNFYLNLDDIPLKLDNLNSYKIFPLPDNLNFKYSKNNKVISQEDKQFFFPEIFETLNALENQPSSEKNRILPYKKIKWEKFINTDFITRKNVKHIYCAKYKKPHSTNIKFGDFNKQKNENSSKFLNKRTKQLPIVTSTSNINNVSKVNSGFSVEKQFSWFLKRALNKCNLSSVSLFSTKSDIDDLNEIILELEQILLEQGLSSFRRMSGYLYPDMNSKKITYFLFHNLFSFSPKNYSLKIRLPVHPNFLNKYFFSNQPIPNFAIKTGSANLQNWDQKRKLYNDIGVFLNEKNGLDWEIKSLSEPIEKAILPKEESSLISQNGVKEEKLSIPIQQNLRFWLNNYLSPFNPLTHSKNSIFGNTVQPNTDLILSQKICVIPIINANEWKIIYQENKNNLENNLSNKKNQKFLSRNDFTLDDIFLPYVEISQPIEKNLLSDKYTNLNFELNSTLDYFYSPHYFSSLSKKQLNQVFFNEKYKPVQYKKLMSIFNKSQFQPKINFSDNWEPLTYHSWLIVSQIGFAFLCFQILKYISTDYFNELIWFILDIGFTAGVIDENLKEEIELITGKIDKGFRVISKNRKTFKDLAGVTSLVSEVSDIVWFLRNSGKDFSVSKTFPRGLLLVGPPGTGKTVLVQAIAGEAKVPVLALSGSSLIKPGESGALKLENLFHEARYLTPCIVFIDEVDTLAQKRQGIMQTPMGGDDITSILKYEKFSLNSYVANSTTINSSLGISMSGENTSFFNKIDPKERVSAIINELGETVNYSVYNQFNKIAVEIKQQFIAQQQFRHQQLSLLMQLLIELDGIRGRKGVIVIGATNRPEALDSAILRPGRFEKVIKLGLPEREKRIEIFKLYGHALGYDKNSNADFLSRPSQNTNIVNENRHDNRWARTDLDDTVWDYLAKRTVGFSAADIASIMNQSSIKAILTNSKHSLKTIEHGIERITTYEIEKPSKKLTQFSINKVAYYQAGKVVLSTILEHHPPTVVSYLWPRPQNKRSLKILSSLQKYFFKFARRCEIEDRIVGCYGGKAAEVLFLQKSPEHFAHLSNFGVEDLNYAFVLICFAIEKWYIYSKSTLLTQLQQIPKNKNSIELSPEKIEFYKQTSYFMEKPPHRLYSLEEDTLIYPLSQNFFSSAWWQLYVSKEFEITDPKFTDWYRLYLPNPEEKEANLDWTPPDEFYNGNVLNKYLTKKTLVRWNDLHNTVRDYQVHGLVLGSFNKALALIDENREFLDKLVFELLKTKILREYEIKNFYFAFSEQSKKEKQNKEKNNKANIKIVNNSFGQQSRRKIKNWIDLKDFKNQV